MFSCPRCSWRELDAASSDVGDGGPSPVSCDVVAAARREACPRGPSNRSVPNGLIKPDAACHDHADAADAEADEADAGLPVRSPDDQPHAWTHNRFRALWV